MQVLSYCYVRIDMYVHTHERYIRLQHVLYLMCGLDKVKLSCDHEPYKMVTYPP